MKSYQVTDHAQSPALVETPTPDLKQGEVLLRIKACGLNFADLLMAEGRYQDTPETPFALGMEVCGEVLAQGPGVTAPAIGSRVSVFCGSGGLADEGVFPADLCIPVPASMPDEVAAGLQIAYGTSHLALTRRARLAPGETLLVLGAAGGVGLTAVEIGTAMGARVIAVARGDEKRAIAKDAGAETTFDATDPDLTEKLKALGGVDVVYDPVGGALFTSALKACNREARVIVIGFASGDVPVVKPNHLLVKNIDLIGFYWGGYMKFAPEALTNSIAELMDWYDTGKLRPHISHILPLDQAAEALELIRSRRSTGKVVVRMTEN